MAARATGTSIYPSTPEFDIKPDSNVRLEELLAANDEITRRKQLYRRESDDLAAALMRSPMSPTETYKYFGAFLGLFPPAAIFGKLFAYGFQFGRPQLGFFALLLVMNLACAFAGGFMGKTLGELMLQTERLSWLKMIAVSPFIGVLWAMVAGGLGGILFFGFGAFFGILFALPVAFIAFPLFALIHRLLERGGQIEYKHFLPLAFGITLTISAFIL